MLAVGKFRFRSIMKNIPRTFLLLAGLFLALVPANQATAQSQYSSSPTDALSLWQAHRAIVSASKYAEAFHLPGWSSHTYPVNPSSIAFTFDSLEFDATNKGETKHFQVDFKGLEKVRGGCNYQECHMDTAGKPQFTIHDKKAVEYFLYFGYSPASGVNACQQEKNNAECMHSANWFAAALNGLHAYAISHPAGSGDFHQQAAAWRALTTKPPLAEGARILRLAAEDAIKRQKPDEALNDFELGVQADPTWAQGWFNAALLAGELGFFADAADHMQNYLELLPDAADAQSARDQIDLWKYKAGQSPAVVK
jgi:tetratricopeptide (TPR) repeat protein